MENSNMNNNQQVDIIEDAINNISKNFLEQAYKKYKEGYERDEDEKDLKDKAMFDLFLKETGITVTKDFKTYQEKFIDILESQLNEMIKLNVNKIKRTLDHIAEWALHNDPETKKSRKAQKWAGKFLNKLYEDDKIDEDGYLIDYFEEQYGERGQTWYGEYKTGEWDHREIDYNLGYINFFEIVANEFDPLGKTQ